MACYSPISAWKPDVGGKLFFTERPHSRPLEIPCGQCVGCRLERSRQWAVRCMHEASLNAFNSFVTLTYDDDHLPLDNSLRYSDFQRFMNSLRVSYKRERQRRLRFYMCGEYGDNFGRPHFHACIFGLNCPDRVLYKRLDSGSDLYTSKYLSRFWPHGFVSVGDVTFESAAYVARYVMKKVTGKLADDHYFVDGLEGGYWRVPEFNKMSLKPGIGALWFERYRSQVYPRDYVVVRGVKCKPPRYYDVLSKDTFVIDDVKFDRFKKAISLIADSTPERLAVREIVTTARLRSKIRTLE